MTTDKELADAYRLACRRLFMHNFDDAAAALKECADALDPPPKPEYPDGTMAWVTNQYGRRYLCTWHAENREWCIGGPDGDSAPGKVTKVEPLRVLADDEIALPRIKSDFSVNWRTLAVEAHRRNAGMVALLCDAYADALDAEAGEQS